VGREREKREVVVSLTLRLVISTGQKFSSILSTATLDLTNSNSMNMLIYSHQPTARNEKRDASSSCAICVTLNGRKNKNYRCRKM
jgi:hypothetical protein